MPHGRRHAVAASLCQTLRMTIPLPATSFGFYGVALAALWLTFGLGHRLRERMARARRDRADAEGDAEPVSLHPVIDPARCIGCGACAHACPEGSIIGLVAGKAQLLDPGSCVGHGACQTACPAGAVDLVFGTARRGIDIPIVTRDLESSVPGVYIAGELGGVGLIANAVEQGTRAIDAIARGRRKRAAHAYDVVIIGAGPAGIAASLRAKELGLRAITFEQQTLGGAVARYPATKLVMTRAMDLPLHGAVRFRRVRKERLLALWQTVSASTRLDIIQNARVDRITPVPGGFEIATSAGVARSATVLMATGRRGAPRRLGVPGESLAKVCYGLDTTQRFAGRHVLVVGGGDTALEAAVELAKGSAASVTLCYRGATFDRAKAANRQRLDDAERRGRVTVMERAHVRVIEQSRVKIESAKGPGWLRNDAVIICAGGLLPTALLADTGVAIDRKFGMP